jgi:hypothetical protein
MKLDNLKLGNGQNWNSYTSLNHKITFFIEKYCINYLNYLLSTKYRTRWISFNILIICCVFFCLVPINLIDQTNSKIYLYLLNLHILKYKKKLKINRLYSNIISLQRDSHSRHHQTKMDNIPNHFLKSAIHKIKLNHHDNLILKLHDWPKQKELNIK